jgi:hypothetical protein
VLLYDEEDVEAQFSLSARSRLSRQDIAGILRSLRRYSARTKSSEIVVTPGEILADDDLETSIEADNPDADTGFAPPFPGSSGRAFSSATKTTRGYSPAASRRLPWRRRRNVSRGAISPRKSGAATSI